MPASLPVLKPSAVKAAPGRRPSTNLWWYSKYLMTRKVAANASVRMSIRAVRPFFDRCAERNRQGRADEDDGVGAAHHLVEVMVRLLERVEVPAPEDGERAEHAAEEEDL